jgi:hypothetical protein
LVSALVTGVAGTVTAFIFPLLTGPAATFFSFLARALLLLILVTVAVL